MQGEGILETIAELSVAFAGFTGVVAAFGRRVGETGSALDAHAFKAMLASSLQALLFSVLPFLLSACGLEEPALWRAASGFMLAGLAIGGFEDFRYAARADRKDWTRIERALGIAILLAGVAATIAQIANALGAVQRSFAPYLGGLLFFLTFSSVWFVRLLMPSGASHGR